MKRPTYWPLFLHGLSIFKILRSFLFFILGFQALPKRVKTSRSWKREALGRKRADQKSVRKSEKRRAAAQESDEHGDGRNVERARFYGKSVGRKRRRSWFELSDSEINHYLTSDDPKHFAGHAFVQFLGHGNMILARPNRLLNLEFSSEFNFGWLFIRQIQ